MTLLRYIDVLQEWSSAKRKEMYRSVQTKAGVSQPTQLLIDMKVRWSSTYIMLNCAETNKEVRISYCHTSTHWCLLSALAHWYFCIRDRSSRAWLGKTCQDRLSSTLSWWMDTCRPIHWSSFSTRVSNLCVLTSYVNLFSIPMSHSKHSHLNVAWLCISQSQRLKPSTGLGLRAPKGQSMHRSLRPFKQLLPR